METLTIHTPFIKLQQAMKLAGLIGNGSDVKVLLAEGLVKVNGQTASERGKKLYDGDTFSFKGQTYTIKSEADAL